MDLTDHLGQKIFEKIDTTIFSDAREASKVVANEIAGLIRARNQIGQNTVLGLATGSTPIQVYGELVRLHREEGLSFERVVTFNLDEYYPIRPEELQSYVRFMNEYLFDHIDIKKENVHIPDGTLEREDVYKYCKEYEQKIEQVGGLDVQILGIGRTGHIGFNEPGSLEKTRTRLVTLDELTRADAAASFFGEEHVPRRAITMGVGTILKAKKIYLMAWGESKASIIQRSVEGEISAQVPATFLQKHENTKVILDEAAASELTRRKTPWLVGPCKWDDRRIRKAVTWLSLKISKPILKLTDEDYNQHGMSDVVTDYGPAYNVNIRVFNQVQHTITGWPGGKPNADDSNRPERAEPFPKRVLIFSPHPDDDVISMGGTLMRLTDHGHEVHIAYQTSGNISVYDNEALRYADFISQYSSNKAEKNLFENLLNSVEEKTPGDTDSEVMLEIKTKIRQAEARAACRYSGLPEENIHFLNMPFYETGRAKKNHLSDNDIRLIQDVMEKVKPHQIYAAGDLSDPHGTHRICWDAIRTALENLKNEAWMKDCFVWLYKGVWQDWDISDIDMAVPLSPDERLKKRRAIFKHASQKDQPKYPGAESREFWMIADERTMKTAKLYDQLGLAEYDSIEGFTRYMLD
ncbi:glucosamine-6-phosphate deaminase [Rhodohalobacter barkolensis]|uniref:Glucosamine-6-phosphate deaminase n=1 Tax=Rhodohalobacter barkolensis TaxID=2053187 RepID=A0A2N0VIQ1_9BACT|nr:glucosamine-6-phosphate deaminase [Rhodohalobacter barkolensis]PKD44066.1 glucosamine-6-phosphate deaminase [Rhodohalobacter barkolensis]